MSDINDGIHVFQGENNDIVINNVITNPNNNVIDADNNTLGSTNITISNTGAIIANDINTAINMTNTNVAGTISIINNGFIRSLENAVDFAGSTSNLQFINNNTIYGNIIGNSLNNRTDSIINNGNISIAGIQVYSATNRLNAVINMESSQDLQRTTNINTMNNSGDVYINCSGEHPNIIKFQTLNNNQSGNIQIINSSNTPGAINLGVTVTNNGKITVINNGNQSAIQSSLRRNPTTGILNITGGIKMQSFPFMNNGTITMNNNAAINIGNNQFDNRGIVEVVHPSSLSGGYKLNMNGLHVIHVHDGIESSLHLLNGVANFAGTDLTPARILINDTGNVFLKDGQILTLVSGQGPAVVDPSVMFSNKYSLTMHYTVEARDNDVIVKVSRTPYNIFASGNNEIYIANTLSALINSGLNQSADTYAVLNAINKSENSNEIKHIISQLTPDMNAAKGVTSSLLTSNIILDNLSNRLDNIARWNNDVISGYAAGDRKVHYSVWAKTFKNYSKQNETPESFGYNSKLNGLTIGIDRELFNNNWIGISSSYSNTKLKTKYTPPDFTHINSYQIALYATFSPTKYYVDGMLAFNYNKYKTIRNINFDNISKVAYANFFGLQPAAKVTCGYIYSYNILKLIPNLSLQYSYLKQQKYNEIGAQSLNFNNFSLNALHNLELGIGLKLAGMYKNFGRVINSDVHVGINYELINIPQTSTATLECGGANLIFSHSTPNKKNFNIGTNFNIIKNDRWQFIFNYDILLKKQFISHLGYIQLKYIF